MFDKLPEVQEARRTLDSIQKNDIEEKLYKKISKLTEKEKYGDKGDALIKQLNDIINAPLTEVNIFNSHPLYHQFSENEFALKINLQKAGLKKTSSGLNINKNH